MNRRRQMRTAQIIVMAMASAIFAGTVQPPAAAQVKAARPQTSEPDSKIPAGTSSDEIRLGERIFEQTPRYAAKYVGNQVNCADCHLEGGRAPYSAPMVGLAHIFPTYNQRAGRVITLAERIQQCFVRSENGRPLAANSREMRALLAYISWLSPEQSAGQAPGRGLIKLPALKGDPGRGAAVYARACSVCHGSDGAGVPPVLPPLWGTSSFNDGAGMSTVEKMAAFVQYNMPQDAPGSLSAQQAYDVAAYVNSKPRPKLNPAYRKY